ncbi:MAG: hypothetical protein RBU26_13015, partial [Sphaerochaeta sp.]|uniref:hypothetical protein n=1 Tax=Sphaerochaeta sp. TaxID=1972642 RepID=UPI002A363A82
MWAEEKKVEINPNFGFEVDAWIAGFQMKVWIYSKFGFLSICGYTAKGIVDTSFLAKSAYFWTIRSAFPQDILSAWPFMT